jgi:hypothetical protein
MTDYKAFVWAALLFAGIFVSGSLLYTSTATYYPGATVPASLNAFTQEANYTLAQMNETARTQYETAQAFQSNDVLGVVTGVLSIPSMLWGVMKAVLFDVPNFVLGLVGGDLGAGYAVPEILVMLVITGIMLFIIFEFISIIFKR